MAKAFTKAFKERKQVGAYVYDHRHLRTRKTDKHGTTLYHYGWNGNLLAETSDAGKPASAYVWMDGLPLAQVDIKGKGQDQGKKPKPAKETVSYLHTDHLGTPRMATDSRRKAVWRWDADAFGTGKPEDHEDEEEDDRDEDNKNVTVNLRFPGQYYDAETGLHYNWHRYYDPKTGRYITSDPIGLIGGLNTYLYVNANPLRWNDPNGLDFAGGWEPGIIPGEITPWDECMQRCIADEDIFEPQLPPGAAYIAEAGARPIASAYFRATDARFKNWGSSSRVLIPRVARIAGNIARAASLPATAINIAEAIVNIERCGKACDEAICGKPRPAPRPLPPGNPAAGEDL